MPKQCLFCPKPVDSAEHIWSDWILKELKPNEPIHIKNKTISKWVDNPEVRIKCVCEKCNNSWMSDMENENKPHIRAMIHDKSVTLKPAQQKSLTKWAILKAIVLDGSSKSRTPFYTEYEKQGIKPPSPFLPVGTLSWIGRFSGQGFHAGLTDTFGEINHVPKAFRSCIVTIVIGHLVIQVLTMHAIPMFATSSVPPAHKPGAWNTNLLNIWPIFSDVNWPPQLSFTPKGEFSIGTLVNRWKIGTNIGE